MTECWQQDINVVSIHNEGKIKSKNDDTEIGKWEEMRTIISTVTQWILMLCKIKTHINEESKNSEFITYSYFFF
jgi:hypothetical protein